MVYGKKGERKDGNIGKKIRITKAKPGRPFLAHLSIFFARTL